MDMDVESKVERGGLSLAKVTEVFKWQSWEE